MRRSSASSSATTRTRRLSSSPTSAVRTNLREYLPLYVFGGVVLLLTLTITRGLWWQWSAILTASPAVPPAMPAAQPAQAAQPAARSGQPAVPNQNPAAAANPGRRPLPPTDEPAPRNTIDRYGVAYDAQGVAVMGID